MTATLTWNRYGKSHIRLVKVRRSRERDELVDLTIDVSLEGAFADVYTKGDNRSCLPTDTMKNSVYAIARTHPIAAVERFAADLAGHFLKKPGVARARIGIAELPWGRIAVDGRPHPHAFVHSGGERWTTSVTRDRVGVTIASGVADLVVMKTSDSAFSGFPRDEYTTLPETRDRILATSITATWTYGPAATDFTARERIRTALLDTFAEHRSESVQHTLYAMGQAALAAAPETADITILMPNRHHVPVDLRPFGLDNPNEIFVATDQPYGLIEATVTRA
jgi:urate oxidase